MWKLSGYLNLRMLNRGSLKLQNQLLKMTYFYSLVLKKYLKLENICQFLEGSLGWLDIRESNKA